MGSRAGVVVTGTEVLTGRVSDRNGPWLAENLRRAGVDIAHVIVVGDRPDDLRSSLRYLIDSGVDLIVTSGGLGPTADDLTAEIVADVQGRSLQLDPELEARIAAVVAGLIATRGWQPDPAATAAGTRKQALVPSGATVIPPVGTAPGLIVPPSAGDRPPVVVLPGPPRELQRMWPAVLADPTVVQAISGHVELRQQTLRFWGTLESDFAATLRAFGPDLDGLEITTCLRDGGELEVVTRYEPAAQASYDAFVAGVSAAYPRTLLSSDGRTVDQLVAEQLISQGLTIATAESCTAGLLAGRLTDLAGSSAYVLGGLVVYSNQAKSELAGVPPELIERVGAVSAEVAEALAVGVRARLHTDLGVGITGVAGPGGGTPSKPVGLVHLCVAGPERTLPYVLHAPGARADVRLRAVAVALRLVHQLLTESAGLTRVAS